MQAYKLKGKIDPAGNLVITDPVKIPPGDVEVIILQPMEADSSTVSEDKSQAETPNKKVQYRTQAFRELLENAPPVPPNFDPDQAKWEYLKEKHNL